LAIEGIAVRALFCLSALFVDFLAYLSALQVIDSGPSELFKKSSTFCGGEQDFGAVLFTTSILLFQRGDKHRTLQTFCRMFMINFI
jgi:hypothetical protein